MLQVLTEDASWCCVCAWSKALKTGALDTIELWECPKCGCEYRVQLVSCIRYWAYFCDAVILHAKT